MQSLISVLKAKDIDVYSVTASNTISAEIICREHFGIPSSNVLGVEIETDENDIIASNLSEIPYAEGKVKALKKKFNNKKPIVTGGDGIWDRFLLDHTEKNGIRLWLGKNIDEYQELKEKYYQDLNFYHIPRAK